MTETTKGLIGGTVLGVAGAALVGFLVFRDSGGDERPPIVVSEGSIKFTHEKGWENHGNNRKKWKSKQQNGRRVKSFTVEVVGAHTEDCSTTFDGKVAVFDFIDESGEDRTFVLFLDGDTANKLQPIVESTEQLVLDNDVTVLKYGSDGTSGNNLGEIVRMDVIGGDTSKTCTFTAAAEPTITVRFVYQ